MQKHNNNVKVVTIAGDLSVGKTFVNKIIRENLSIVLNMNRLDFITKKLLSVLNILPTQINWNFHLIEELDRKFMTDSNLIYVRNNIKRHNKMTLDNFKYFIDNILKIRHNIINYKDEKISSILDDINFVIKSPIIDEKIKPVIYSITQRMFDNIVSLVVDFDIYSEVRDLINSQMSIYNYIYTIDNSYRLCYYAYNLNELKYFKENYNAISIFVDMEYYLQSQTILNKEGDIGLNKLNIINTEKRQKELENMKQYSNMIINNNYELPSVLQNKIMTYISNISM